MKAESRQIPQKLAARLKFVYWQYNTMHTTAQPQHDGGKAILELSKKTAQWEDVPTADSHEFIFSPVWKKTTKTRRKTARKIWKNFKSEVMTTFF